MNEWVKEAIRRLLFIPCFLGLSDGEFKATVGTRWYRFLNWLYANGEPEFDVQWPEDKEEPHE